MTKLSVRPTDKDLEDFVFLYSNMLFRLCFTMLGTNADAEDAVSETAVKYITHAPSFKDDEHRKAWLIRTASNICKDMLRRRKRHQYASLDDIREYCVQQENADIINEVLSLPPKYRAVIYLYYIEGYTSKEIADILSVTTSAVRKRLQYGRDMLRIEHGKDE